MALKNVGLLWEKHRHWFYIKTVSKTKMTQHLDEEQVNRNHTMPSNKQGRFLCTWDLTSGEGLAQKTILRLHVADKLLQTFNQFQ